MPTVHANISDAASEGINDWCGEAGVSVTGLIEALGVHLQAANESGDRAFAVSPSSPHTFDRALVLSARQIDADRRRRTRKAPTP